MARYLALPKNDAVVASLSVSEVLIDPDSRNKQVEKVVNMRRSLGAQTRGDDPVAAVSAHSADIVAHPEETTTITGIMIFDLDDKDELDAIRKELPEYEVVEDLPLSLIPPTRKGPKLTASGSVDTWHLEAILVKAARAAGFDGNGKNVGVSILDTGVEEVSEIAGRVKSAFELDRATNTERPIATKDTEGHGTHVAGLVAGSTVGVAPEADLMNFIMIPQGFGNVSDFIFALDFVARQPEIAIINMSAGIPGYIDSMQPSISLARRVGVLPVIAVGNEGPNTSRSPGNYAEVLSVGASTRDSKVWSSSSGGTMVPNSQSYDVPDLVAPGADVTSCVMGGGYEAWNGTSMATPLVSGVAALIVEKFPNISLADLTDEILSAAVKLPSAPDIRQGRGLLQFPRHIWHLGS